MNNEFVDAKSGKKYETINPSTGKVICSVADAQKEDVEKAVAAAKDAFKLGGVLCPCFSDWVAGSAGSHTRGRDISFVAKDGSSD